MEKSILNIALDGIEDGNSTSDENLELECPTNCCKAIKVLMDDKADVKRDLVEKSAYIKSLEEKLSKLEIKSSIEKERKQLLTEKIKDKDDVIATLKSSIEMYKTMKTSVVKPDEIIDHILALKQKLSQLTERKVNIGENVSQQKDVQKDDQLKVIKEKNETISQLQNELKTCKQRMIGQLKSFKSHTANYKNTIKQLKDKPEAAIQKPPTDAENNILIKNQQVKINEHLNCIKELNKTLKSVKAECEQLKVENNEYKRDNLIYKNQVIMLNTKLTTANDTVLLHDQSIKKLKSTIAKLQKSSSKSKPGENKEPSVSFQLLQIEGLKPFVATYDDDLMDCQPKWMIIQRRIDGAISFDRFWTDYCTGFGNNNHEFWLGLEKLHVLTTNQRHELYIHFTDMYNQVRYAYYDNFTIASDEEKYELRSLGTYTGNAGDIMRKYEAQPFDTHDSSGGWWYTKDQESHLNGQYMKGKSKDQEHGICFPNWYFGSSIPLKSVRMLIRPYGKKEKKI